MSIEHVDGKINCAATEGNVIDAEEVTYNIKNYKKFLFNQANDSHFTY